MRSLPAKELLGVLQLQLRLGHMMNELFGLYFGSLHLRDYCGRGYGPLVPLRVVALRGLSMKVHIVVAAGVEQRLGGLAVEGTAPSVNLNFGCHV